MLSWPFFILLFFMFFLVFFFHFFLLPFFFFFGFSNILKAAGGHCSTFLSEYADMVERPLAWGEAVANLLKADEEWRRLVPTALLGQGRPSGGGPEAVVFNATARRRIAEYLYDEVGKRRSGN